GPAGDRKHDQSADIKENERRHELLELHAHDCSRDTKQYEPEQKLVEIELRVLGKVTGQLAERIPFESAGIDRERLDYIAAAGLEQDDGEDHQPQPEPDRPPILFQIKFVPAPALRLCRFAIRP